jgi:hypothetical protein
MDSGLIVCVILNPLLFQYVYPSFSTYFMFFAYFLLFEMTKKIVGFYLIFVMLGLNGVISFHRQQV